MDTQLPGSRSSPTLVDFALEEVTPTGITGSRDEEGVRTQEREGKWKLKAGSIREGLKKAGWLCTDVLCCIFCPWFFIPRWFVNRIMES
jgi:hypothetical protein